MHELQFEEVIIGEASLFAVGQCLGQESVLRFEYPLPQILTSVRITILGNQ